MSIVDSARLALAQIKKAQGFGLLTRQSRKDAVRELELLINTKRPDPAKIYKKFGDLLDEMESKEDWGPWGRWSSKFYQHAMAFYFNEDNQNENARLTQQQKNTKKPAADSSQYTGALRQMGGAGGAGVSVRRTAERDGLSTKPIKEKRPAVWGSRETTDLTSEKDVVTKYNELFHGEFCHYDLVAESIDKLHENIGLALLNPGCSQTFKDHVKQWILEDPQQTSKDGKEERAAAAQNLLYHLILDPEFPLNKLGLTSDEKQQVFDFLQKKLSTIGSYGRASVIEQIGNQMHAKKNEVDEDGNYYYKPAVQKFEAFFRDCRGFDKVFAEIRGPALDQQAAAQTHTGRFIPPSSP